MSTPNDNENDISSTYCEDCGCFITIGRCKHGVMPPTEPAIQPSPAAVEQALAEEKANAEKIGATVQAARAGATQPPQCSHNDREWQLGNWTCTECGDVLREKPIEPDKEYRTLRDELDRVEQERDALQAQRDELLVTLKKVESDYLSTNEVDLEGIQAAIARATEGGTGQ